MGRRREGTGRGARETVAKQLKGRLGYTGKGEFLVFNAACVWESCLSRCPMRLLSTFLLYVREKKN